MATITLEVKKYEKDIKKFQEKIRNLDSEQRMVEFEKLNAKYPVDVKIAYADKLLYSHWLSHQLKNE